MQGLGAAILAPAALSMVTNMFQEGAERNKALGIWGAVSGSGGAAGVLLGGVLTEYLGWEWVLWVNVPIAILTALLAPRLLDESRRESEVKRFDALGAITVTAGLSLLVFALVDTLNAGWGSTQTLSLLAISAVLLAAFVVIERRSVDPLVPFRIFRLRTLTGANIVGLLIGASLFAMFFFLSRYMQEVLGYSALDAGLSYLPLAIVIIVSAGGAAQLVTKLGFKAVLATGLVLIMIAPMPAASANALRQSSPTTAPCRRSARSTWQRHCCARVRRSSRASGTARHGRGCRHGRASRRGCAQGRGGARRGGIGRGRRSRRRGGDAAVSRGLAVCHAATLQTARGVPSAIIDEADERDAAILVSGTRGQSQLASALLGSSTEALVNYAGRPVLLVPAPALTGPLAI